MSFDTVFKVFSWISLSCSFCVVLTGIIFPSLSTPKRPFTHCVFMISLCDLLGCFGNTFGFLDPTSHPNLCFFQAFSYLYFFPASWIWTTMFCYHLKCLMLYKKLFLGVISMHCIGWGLPLFLVLLPTIDDIGFGINEDYVGKTVCNLTSDRKNISSYWYAVIFLGILFLCFSFMTYMTYEIACYMKEARYNSNIGNRDSNIIDRNGTFTKTFELYNILKLYPSAMAVWIPNLIIGYICIFLFNSRSPDTTVSIVLMITEIIFTQNGTLLTIIFFLTSKLARQKWKKLFIDIKNRLNGININSFNEKLNLSGYEPDEMHDVSDDDEEDSVFKEIYRESVIASHVSGELTLSSLESTYNN